MLDVAKIVAGWTGYFVGFYRAFTHLLPNSYRVNKDNDLDSPLLSLQRLMIVDHPLEMSQVVGFGHTLYTTQPIFCWSPLIRLFRLNDRDAALQRWSVWFGETIEEGQGLIDKHDQFRKRVGEGGDENYSRARLNAIERCVIDRQDIWWGPIDALFSCSATAVLMKRYNALGPLVKEARGQLPQNGMVVLHRLWILGNEWKVREAVEGQTECPTPYKALRECLEQGKNGEKHHIDLGELTPWIKKIHAVSEKDSPLSVELFHRYLKAVVASLGVTACHEKVARLELALSPHLTVLFAQVDPQHQMWIAKVQGKERVLIGEEQYNYKECLYENIHIFEGKEGDERLLFFGAHNDAELYLAYAKLSNKPQIHCISDTFSFFELEQMQRVDWKQETPEGIVAALKELGDTMPQHLSETLCSNAKGMACWLPTDNCIPLCPATVEAFLFECSEKECAEWMKESGLLEKGKAQRSKVIKACSGENIGLSTIEWEAKGAFSYAMQIHKLSAEKLEAALIKESCVLRLPANLSDYAS